MKKLNLILLLAGMAFAGYSQTNTMPSTNLITIPNSALDQLINILPAWDSTATNAFAKGDLYLKTAPLWKSAFVSGTTPFLSVAGEYFPTLNFGFGGEVAMFGTGTGNDSIDSGSMYGVARLPRGNLAPYLIFGAGRDFNAGKWMGEAGAGFAYQYKTQWGMFVDTRYAITGEQNNNGWMTRVGVSLRF